MDIQSLQKIDVEQIIKNKTIAISVAIALVSLLFARSMFVNKSKKISAFRKTLSKELKLEKHIKEIVDLDVKISGYKKDSLEGASTDELIKIATETLKNNNISIQSLNPEVPIDKGLYTKFPIRLGFQTDFARLGKFISSLENNKKSLFISSLSVSKSAREQNVVEEKENLSVELKIWSVLIK